MAAEARRGSDFVEQLTAGGRDGTEELIGGQPFVWRDGILRQRALLSESQAQTADTFGFKWERTAELRVERVPRDAAGLVAREVRQPRGRAVVGRLRPGAGAARRRLRRRALGRRGLRRASSEAVRYLGVDVSHRGRRRGTRASPSEVCAQASCRRDLTTLPLAGGSVDVIFSEGVLHHTDSTRAALLARRRTAAEARRSHPLLRVPPQGARSASSPTIYIRERLQPR